MSIVQDALKKAQGDYVEKKMPPLEVFHRIKKPKSMRLPTLVSILAALTLIYGLMLSMQYFRAPRNVEVVSVEQKNISARIPAAKPDNPIVEPKLAVPEHVTLPKPDFVLSGIMYLQNKPQAIINGYMLEEGDELNGATVMAIEKDCVLLDIENKNVRIELAKER